ncbi:MAG: protein kinase [Gemmatimonadaceae bacterium]|nr:protein kinase [Gemmatimonadaceae bacterium]
MHGLFIEISPSNVLLDGGAAVPKIADFGLAKLATAATRTETFKGWGTPAYMAPEAWDGAANTTAMDLYSGGVLFFELATFQYPVQPRLGDPPTIAWRNAHLLVAPTNARTLRADLSIELWQLITRLLQKDPKKRPATWAEVKTSLARSLPVSAPDVSSLVRRATERTVASDLAAAAARASQEQALERRQLLTNACEEPIAILQELVATFNAASDLGALEISRERDDVVTVRKQPGSLPTPSLVVRFRQIEDLEVRADGIYRVIGAAAIEPEPKPAQQSDYFDNESLGGFNLLYRVRRADDRFGEWYQLRFEMSPMGRERRYPHWWAHGLDKLPRELRLLSAVHVYQNQRRPLDHDWFRDLLAHLV